MKTNDFLSRYHKVVKTTFETYHIIQDDVDERA